MKKLDLSAPLPAAMLSKIGTWSPEKLRKEAGIYRSEAAELEEEGEPALAKLFRNRAETFEALASQQVD